MHHFFQTCWHLMKNYILEDKFSLCRAVEIFFPFFLFFPSVFNSGDICLCWSGFQLFLLLEVLPFNLCPFQWNNDISWQQPSQKKDVILTFLAGDRSDFVQVRSEPVPAPCPLQGTCPTAWHHQYPLPGLSLLLLLLQLRWAIRNAGNCKQKGTNLS